MKKSLYLGSLMSLIAFVLISSVALKAQPWMDNLTDNQKQNFFEIQKSFEKYWKDKDITEKGKGWKPFKRWEWYWEPRVSSSGNFPDPLLIYNEKQKKSLQKSKGNRLQGIGDWTFLGPSTNAGGYGGLGRVNCVREDPSAETTLWAGAASGGLWKSTDGGTTWSTNTDDLGSIGISDIAFGNNGAMYIATGDCDAGDIYSIGVLKSIDGGLTWNQTGLVWPQSTMNMIGRLLIIPGAPNILFAGTRYGIFKSIDGGENWTNPYTVWVKDMELNPGNSQIIYASTYSTGGASTIVKSEDGGETWNPSNSGLPVGGVSRIALGVTPVNSDIVYALLSNNTDTGFKGFYRSNNSGDSWELMSVSPNILGWNTNGSDVGGQGWYDLCIAVSQTNADELYIGGVNVWKSVNGGANWQNLTSWTTTVHADQHDLWFVPGTNRLYCGNDGGVYKSTNSGTTWPWLGSGLKITQFYRLGCSATNANLVIAGSQDNGTKLENAGTWKDVIGGDGMEAIIDYSNANIMYGELYYGNIRKSTNGGSSWSAMSLPSESGSSLGAWITPYVLHPTSSSTLYVGYRNLFKTSNNGKTWTKLTNFTTGNIRVLNIAPSNANYIYVGKSTGYSIPPIEFNRTTNGGTSWTALTLPSDKWLTYLAVSQTDPLKIWATFSSYNATEKVFYSDNGGTSWTNITGSGLPNLPVNCIVYQKDNYNRVYIGNDMGVYYKDDNTTDWTEFSNGLPNVVIDELEIQYGTMKLRAATYGRGLWEASIPSAPIYLDPPALAQPADAATDVAVPTILSWSTVANATGYILLYSTDNTFATYTTMTTTGTSATLSGLSYLTTYYWKVQATKGENKSSFSNPRSFTTMEEPLPAPVLVSPSNDATNVSTSPTLSWNAVSGATSYDLEYSKASTFSPSTAYNDISVTSKSLSGLSKRTTYYWRVLAKNANSVSVWSSVWNFKTANSGKFGTGEEEIGTQSATLEFYPNPLSSSAHFILDVIEPEMISIDIVDILGNSVAKLMNEQKTAGTYEFEYDASNLLPGVYYCHLMVGNEITTMKLVIVR